MNIEHALVYARMQLNGSESPEIDSKILLCHALECKTSYLHTWPDKELTTSQQTQFEMYLQQRVEGKPIAHIIGQCGFWSLDLNVTPDTLIPRPDTELLVTLALTKLVAGMTVADLGTGSGAIALALAMEMPDIKIVASDFSRAALQVAKDNARYNHINHVCWIKSNWLEAFKPSVFDLIVSNPPYIVEDDPHLNEGDVRFEPLTALVSGKDGLDDIRVIVKQAKHCLKTMGWLMVEHGYHQAAQVKHLFSAAGFKHVASHQDFGGNDRVVIGQLTL